MHISLSRRIGNKWYVFDDDVNPHKKIGSIIYWPTLRKYRYYIPTFLTGEQQVVHEEYRNFDDALAAFKEAWYLTTGGEIE